MGPVFKRMHRVHPNAVYFGILGRAVSDPPVDYTGDADNAGVINGRVGDRPS